jgi:hypothetical protein
VLRGRCGSCPTSHSLGSIRMPFWGLTSDAVACVLAGCGDKVVCTHGRCFRRTRRVGDLALALGCGLGLSVPGTRLIRSVPSPAAALCNFAPSSVETCWGEGLAAGPG